MSLPYRGDDYSAYKTLGPQLEVASTQWVFKTN